MYIYTYIYIYIYISQTSYKQLATRTRETLTHSLEVQSCRLTCVPWAFFGLGKKREPTKKKPMGTGNLDHPS